MLYDVANTPVQNLASEENTKAIYKSYMTPVFEFAQKKGWNIGKQFIAESH